MNADLEYAIQQANDLIEEMGEDYPITLPDDTIIPCIPDEQPGSIERRFGYNALEENDGQGALFYVRMQDKEHFGDGKPFRYNDLNWRVKHGKPELKVQFVVLACLV